MAGPKLQGRLKKACDAYFKYDPVKYKRLIEWVYRHQRAHWKDDVLVEAMRIYWPHRDQAEWWKPLTGCLRRAHNRLEIAACEGYKKDDLTQAGAVLRKILEVGK